MPETDRLAAIRERAADYRRAPARWVHHATTPDGIPADLADLLAVAEAARAHLDWIDDRHYADPEGRSENLDLCAACAEPWPCEIFNGAKPLRRTVEALNG